MTIKEPEVAFSNTQAASAKAQEAQGSAQVRGPLLWSKKGNGNCL
jgi:hypothetical protein